MSLSWSLCGTSILVELEFGDAVFLGEKKTEELGEKPSEKGENQQQTQPTYGTERNRTRVTLAGGERPHNYDPFAPLVFLHRAKLLYISDSFKTEFFLVAIFIAFPSSYANKIVCKYTVFLISLAFMLKNIAFHNNLSPIASISIIQLHWRWRFWERNWIEIRKLYSYSILYCNHYLKVPISSKWQQQVES